MSFLTKPLAVRPLVVGIVSFAAQARNLTYYHSTPSAPKRWTTNFGFQPASSKPSICIEIQIGFWSRPLCCTR